METNKNRQLSKQGAVINIIFASVFILIGTAILLINKGKKEYEWWSITLIASVFFIFPIASFVLGFVLYTQTYPSRGIEMSSAVIGSIWGIVGGLMIFASMGKEKGDNLKKSILDKKDDEK